jgi:lactoylglutathione lyase
MPAIPQQLNHVAILSTNVERSTAFYRDVLLLGQIPRPNFDFPGAWLRLGVDQELHVIGVANGPTAPAVNGRRSNHYALLIDDASAWEQHLRGMGVAFPPKRIRPDGAWQINVQDPDGHWIELCTLPGVAWTEAESQAR